MIIGYCRVSTFDQNLDLQKEALKEAGCKFIYEEKQSGKNVHRPVLQECLSNMHPHDTLVVYKLDRLSRSLKDTINIVEDLQSKGIHLKSITEGIDTSTTTGKLFYQMNAIFAEHERALIKERTMAGLAAARARGKKGGRPLKHSDEKMKHVIKLYVNNEISMPDVNRMYNISTPTFYRRYNEIMKKQEGEQTHVI